jgi:hypothetical protein
MTIRSVAFLLFATSACSARHLQYDFGRAYVDTLRMQADLTRPSALTEGYLLYGPEGIRIRLNAQEQTADIESGSQTVEN